MGIIAPLRVAIVPRGHQKSPAPPGSSRQAHDMPAGAWLGPGHLQHGSRLPAMPKQCWAYHHDGTLDHSQHRRASRAGGSQLVVLPVARALVGGHKGRPYGPVVRWRGSCFPLPSPVPRYALPAFSPVYAGSQHSLFPDMAGGSWPEVFQDRPGAARSRDVGNSTPNWGGDRGGVLMTNMGTATPTQARD
jgi:hypothetical protein